MLTRRLLLILAAAAPVALLGGKAALSADDPYPSRVITMIVPYAAGGPSDTVARLLAESMGQTLGQQVVVENVGGASGTIGAGRAARADPDGYTLLLHTSAHATNTLLYDNLQFDAATDFEPIGVVIDTPMTVVGRPDLPAESVDELLEYIRTNKEDVTYGNAGVGGPSHLCGMMLSSRLDAPMTMVPYKGTGPALTDLLGSQIDLMCDQATNTMGHIRSGAVKAYAVTTKERLAALPDVPTLDEAGLEGFEQTVWLGLYAPKGTPKEAIDKVTGALHEALRDPTVVERLGDLASMPAPPERASPEAL
ncbi:MAG TPA: tripartite tricarboxylate transporter substrate-binding protein, partial [Geminicoccaceae bacterium]|nr:tripartite tricarboxylate transporter substrate-binding protein [Geminicoccaceae bacterium]